MKPSRYNLIFDHNGKKLAFNTSSCALAEVDKSFLNVLNHCKDLDFYNDSELIKNMKEGSYIVEDDCDELEQLKMLNYIGKFNSKDLSLVIAPTLNCNFACPYCFENSQKGFINKDVQKALFDWVEKSAKNKSNINISWYGGEPLLAKDIIFKMSNKFLDICKKQGVDYNAYIVTNGYLADDVTVEAMAKAKITYAQVTIDGPEDVHNSRRKLKVINKEGTFNKIIENIKKMISKNINVSIRINVDKTNFNRIGELLDVLKFHHLEKCSVYLGHVRPYTDTCSSITPTCFNTKEYANVDLESINLLRSKDFESSGYPHYPFLKHNYCGADSISTFVIDPKGNVYKCWNDVGNISRKVGNILEKEIYFNHLHISYMLSSPFDNEECKNCNILPICMGGCPYEKLEKGKPDCEKWLYNLLNILKFTYDNENMYRNEVKQ